MAPGQSKQQTYVLGVGLTKFIKPRGQRDYPEMGYEAGLKALLDAQINYDEVQAGIACFCNGDSGSGQRVFYQYGMTGIPIYNTNNACASGSSGIYLARTLIENGAADCILVVGFEKMQPGSITSPWTDRSRPTELSGKMMDQLWGTAPGSLNHQYFGNAGREYMNKYVTPLYLKETGLTIFVCIGMEPRPKTLQRLAVSATSTRSVIHTRSSARSIPYRKFSMRL